MSKIKLTNKEIIQLIAEKYKVNQEQVSLGIPNSSPYNNGRERKLLGDSSNNT